MTSDRVYRARLSRDEALAELERCSGTQFDPAIVETFSEDLDYLAPEQPQVAAVVA